MNETASYEEFFGAYEGEDYQTDASEAAEETESTEEVTESAETPEAAEAAESAETAEEEKSQDADKDGAEAKDEADKGVSEQMFTIKVNKEERQVGLEEMTALAQKGADYDRVKEQFGKSQQTIQEMQAKLDGYTGQQGALDILSIIAERAGSSMEELAESLYISFRKNSGASEDVAKEELKSAKLEKELKSIKDQKAKQQEQQDDSENRAKRDLEEFQKNYPGIELSEELVNKLLPSIKEGLSLTASYRKYEKDQDAAKIAELERQLQAEKQNKKNRASTPGSQKDSGGQRKKDAFDDFFDAFEK